MTRAKGLAGRLIDTLALALPFLGLAFVAGVLDWTALSYGATAAAGVLIAGAVFAPRSSILLRAYFARVSPAAWLTNVILAVSYLVLIPFGVIARLVRGDERHAKSYWKRAAR
ncbi:MAG: hypothetical protein AB7E79_02815 [Rhodospirillaceae bacterium]